MTTQTGSVFQNAKQWSGSQHLDRSQFWTRTFQPLSTSTSSELSQSWRASGSFASLRGSWGAPGQLEGSPVNRSKPAGQARNYQIVIRLTYLKCISNQMQTFIITCRMIGSVRMLWISGSCMALFCVTKGDLLVLASCITSGWNDRQSTPSIINEQKI